MTEKKTNHDKREETAGDFGQAIAYAQQSVPLHRLAGNPRAIAASLNTLNEQGNLDAAQQIYKESLAIRRGLGDRNGMAVSLTIWESPVICWGSTLKPDPGSRNVWRSATNGGPAYRGPYSG